jgi:hypothetical protein
MFRRQQADRTMDSSIADASKSWDLRCDIREKQMAYIQKNHPQSLPQLRASIDPMPVD